MKKYKGNIKRVIALTLAGLMTFCSMELSSFAAENNEIQNAEVSVVSDVDLPENEELFTGYLEQMFYGNNNVSMFAVDDNTAGSKLTGDEKLAYDTLVPLIKEIASGSRTSAVIALGQELTSGGTTYSVDKEVEFTELYADFITGDIVTALLADYPYEMYWYDKTQGLSISSFSDSDGYLLYVEFTFEVADNYQGTEANTVNATAAIAAQTAVDNAQTILTENEDKTDYEKLVAYRDEIMELVSYDDAAAESGTFSTDNDPWQLIHVFDGDTETNVVCEGYAKAFQYLCDMTTFSGDVSCYSVSGEMSVDSDVPGGHMWNIVTIGDANYLVDVTNSDDDTVGSDGTLFLAGTSGSIEEGYTFTTTNNQSVSFTYDSDMTSYWGSDDSSILNLAAENYSPDSNNAGGGDSDEDTHICGQDGFTYTADDTANTISVACQECGNALGTATLEAPATEILIYTGSKIEAAVENSITADSITPSVNYEGDLTDGYPVNAGTYTATMTVGDVSVSVEFTIEQAQPSYTVLGELTAFYGQTLGDVTLPTGEEGTWAWTEGNSTSVGGIGIQTHNATFTPSDQNNYKTVTVDVTVQVEAADITNATLIVDSNADTTYTGSEITPAVTVTLNGNDLVENTDYTVAYTDNINVGTATVTVTGKGNYQGSVSTTFAIAKATVVVSVPTPKTDLIYSGSAQELIAAGSTTGGELQYSLDNTNWSTVIPTGTDAGTYTVYYKVVGGTNYEDVAAQSFTVTISPIIVTHAHVWTYVADEDNNTITATCSGEAGTCPVENKTVVITLVAPFGEFVYDGTTRTASVTQTPENAFADLDASDISYTGDWKSAGEHSVTITYGGMSVSEVFTIKQAASEYTVPTGLTANYGDTLADVILPDNFTWQDALTTKVGDAGTHTFKVTYTPDDAVNYTTVKDIEVTITMAECTHSGGTATCIQKATCTTCGEQYGSFGGHGTTEIRGFMAATCAANGYTGDSYCKLCGAKTAYGYATAKLTHNYVSVITKEPTCELTGTKTHTCSGCNDVLTETLLQTGHDYKSEITIQPTTEKEGVRTYTCKKCGSLYTKSIDKLEPEPEKTEPFIKGNGGKEGWEAIEDELKAAKDDDIYIIDMNNSCIVPGEVLSAIKGKDVIVVFDLGNDITWRVNGANVTSDNIADIDFALEVGTSEKPLNNIPSDVQGNVTGERYSKELSLAYEGKFGFKAVLSINMGAENAGLYANLFYYNPDAQKLEFVCADDIAKDGTTTLTFDHASDYIIIVDAESMYNVSTDSNPVSDENTDNKTEASTDGFEEEESRPSTDKETSSASVNKGAKDNWGIIWFLVIGGALLIVILVVVVIRRKNDIDF